MSLFQNHAGYYIANNKFQLVEIYCKENNFYLENVDEQLFDEIINPSIKESDFINILQKSFDQISNRKAPASKHVSVALHHDFFRIVELPYDNTLTNRDLIEHFNWELKLLFPSELPEDYLIRFIEVDKSNVRKDKTAIIVAVNKRLLNAVHKFCMSNNMTLKIADNMHLATNTFLNLDNDSLKNEVYFSLMINQNDLSFMIVDEENPVTFSVSKFENNSEIIPILKNEFEKLKRYDLAAENISKSYIYGENQGEDLIEEINSELDISLVKINPFDQIKKNPHLYENQNFIEEYNSFASAAGVALRLQ